MNKRTAILWAAFGGVLFAQRTGSIQGTVVDETGALVSNAFVTYLRTPYTDKDVDPVGDGVMTSAKGAFAFTRLIPATYTLCVQTAPQRGYVEPCEWTFTPPKVVLSAGQAATGVKLAIEHGVRLEFEVGDPGKILPDPVSPQARGPQANNVSLRVGARSPEGLLHMAKFRSRESAFSEYWLIAPHDLALRPHLSGNNLTPLDGAGKARPQGDDPAPVQAARGTGVLRLRYSVH